MYRKSSNEKRDTKHLGNESKVYGVYTDAMLTKKILLNITEIGKNVKENLQKKISSTMEGKCIEEGFIRPGSTRILTYSNGVINTENVEFQTVFTCKMCHPVEGMLIECQSKTITKAGIHAEVMDNDNIPVTVFVARDHHNMDRHFQSVKENATIFVKVIGIRYELNDPYICVIGKLVDRPAERGAAQPAHKARKTTRGGHPTDASFDGDPHLGGSDSDSGSESSDSGSEN